MKRIQLVVRGADVDHSVGHRGRGVDGSAGGGCPEGLARGGGEGIQLVVRRADVDHPVGHRGRGGVDVRAGGGRPEGFARGGGEGIQLVVLGADVDYPVGHRRRREDDIAGGGRPEGLARGGGEGIQLVVRGADVDYPVGHRGRGGDAIVECPAFTFRQKGGCPEGLARGGGEGIQLVVIGADVDHPVGHRRRGSAAKASGGRPVWHQMGDVCGSEHFLVGVKVGVLGIKAKHDPLGGSSVVRPVCSRNRGLSVGRCTGISVGRCSSMRSSKIVIQRGREQSSTSYDKQKHESNEQTRLASGKTSPLVDDRWL